MSTTPDSPKSPKRPRKISPTAAKGQHATRVVAAAQDTVTISPTLLAALVTRSVAKAFEPILAELRDIARTSHDTSDRLFGEELRAKAERNRRVTATEVSNDYRLESQRLLGLMDKLWEQGYRPTATAPVTCRSFHEFEAMLSR